MNSDFTDEELKQAFDLYKKLSAILDNQDTVVALEALTLTVADVFVNTVKENRRGMALLTLISRVDKRMEVFDEAIAEQRQQATTH